MCVFVRGAGNALQVRPTRHRGTERERERETAVVLEKEMEKEKRVVRGSLESEGDGSLREMEV